MATMMLRIDELEPGDEGRVESTLRALPGVFGVVVSPSGGCVEVDFEDDEVDLDRLLERLDEAGFPARLSA